MFFHPFPFQFHPFSRRAPHRPAPAPPPPQDGTLSVSVIDYVKMRSTVDIPVGDLFTVMETWGDGDRIKRSMDAILEIEAVAAAQSVGMPGLEELLAFLEASPARVGLVTRNTTESVDAFFAAVGERWRGAFDILLTREHPHVKPDKRCLLHFAQAWGIPPHRLLMVGDSTEDVECGNAAGTATCFIAGGGNEVVEGGAGPPPPPPGAVPTFAVESLGELETRLRLRDTGLGWGAYSTGTVSISSGEDSDFEGGGGALASLDLDAAAPGAPPPGLEFLDWLFAAGAVEAAACSFPRIDGARFGVPPDDHPGSKVLHLQCGNGALTKLLFSSGLLVVGADPAPAAAAKRGLVAAAVPALDAVGALGGAAAAVGSFDAAVLLGAGPGQAQGLEEQLWRREGLAEVARVLRPGGRMAVEAEVGGGADRARDDIQAELEGKLRPAGLRLDTLEVVRRSVEGTTRVRAVAVKA